MKKSFSLLELIFALTLISLTTLFIINQPTKAIDRLELAANRLILYLKQTRYQAMLEDFHNKKEDEWHKKRWTFKFFNCRKDVGGIYYVIYSDRNMLGKPNKDESLKDPLTNRYIYSSNYCKENSDTSKYVLLTKEFGVTQVNVSCKSETNLGQLSFGSDGKVYYKLSTDKKPELYEINTPCKIELIDKDENKKVIAIENETGYIYKI